MNFGDLLKFECLLLSQLDFSLRFFLSYLKFLHFLHFFFVSSQFMLLSFFTISAFEFCPKLPFSSYFLSDFPFHLKIFSSHNFFITKYREEKDEKVTKFTKITKSKWWS